MELIFWLKILKEGVALNVHDVVCRLWRRRRCCHCVGTWVSEMWVVGGPGYIEDIIVLLKVDSLVAEKWRRLDGRWTWDYRKIICVSFLGWGGSYMSTRIEKLSLSQQLQNLQANHEVTGLCTGSQYKTAIFVRNKKQPVSSILHY